MMIDDHVDHVVPDQAATVPCRLCAGTSAVAFTGTVLEKHTISYYRCAACGSLETEEPYWLGEAYAEDSGEGTNNLADLDTGAAQRNLLTSAGVLVAATILGLRNVIDYGGGDGLLARLLRDYGLNAYVADRYAPATYARGFTQPDFATPDLVTAFEVLEHFAAPGRDLEALFGAGPKAVLVSTDIYDGFGADWPYLTPQTGQHVFFYSRPGFKLIAQKYGYDVLHAGFFTLFYRPGTPGWKIRMLGIMLRYKPLTLIRAGLAFKAPRGSWEDADRLRERNAKAASITSSR